MSWSPEAGTRRLVAGAGLLLVLTVAPPTVPACDVCAVYTATQLREGRVGAFAGVAEQYSAQKTLLDDGDEVPNPAGERLLSSITQVVAGYTVTPRVAFQVNLPIVSRSYRRLEGERVRDGDETGPGDLTVLGRVLAWSHVGPEGVLRFTLLGGLELPSGDPDRLAEELAEAATGPVRPRGRRLGHRLVPRHATGPDAGPDEGGARDDHHASAIHGHDLALGSGSVDGVVGAQLFWSWRRLFASATVQYAIRTEGSFDYRYADDLTWSGGPGWFPLLDHGWVVGLLASVSGETKGKDEQRGQTLDDTAVTALYAGPGLLVSWGSSFAGEIAADLPVIQHVTGLQSVPDFRIRAGFTWHF